MKFIKVQGTNYECGVQYGKLAKKDIKYTIYNYFELFRDRCILTHDQACSIAKEYEKYIPEPLIKEMHGIADGAECLYEDILAINLNNEILLGRTNTSTSISYLNGISGQTWDTSKILRGTLVVYEILSEENTMMFVLEAGLIGSKGYNSHHIALTFNSMDTGVASKGTPLNIKMRMALEKHRLDDALSVLNIGPFSCAANFIISDLNNDYDIELTHSDAHIIGKHQTMVHTNHYLSLRFKANYSSSTLSSNKRYNRAKLLANSGTQEVEDIKAILSDSAEDLNSICYEADSSLPLMKQISTNAIVVFNLNELVLYVCEGSPKRNGFVAYPLSVNETK